MVADDAQHVLAVGIVAREGAPFAGHARRLRVGFAGKDGRQRGGHGAPLVRVVSQAHDHEKAAEVGVAQAQGAVIEGSARDLLRGELRHDHRNLQHRGPDADRVAVGFVVERTGLRVEEGHQVQRGQVAGRVVEEHVFGTGIGAADLAVGGAGVPFVDRAVVLDARIGAGPGGAGHLVPQRAGFQGFHRFAAGARHQVPVQVILHRLHEAVVHPDGVVGRLPGDRVVGFGFPAGIVLRQLRRRISLAVHGKDLVDPCGGHACAQRVAHAAAQAGIGLEGQRAIHVQALVQA